MTRRRTLSARRAPDKPIQLVYEDDELAVVEKPAGLLSVPSPRGEKHTLFHRLCEHRGKGLGGRVHAVHRLDKETSGLIVFAIGERAKKSLDAQFKAHAVERLYLALVQGRPPGRGTLRSRLAEGSDQRMRSVAKGEASRAAVTHYRTLRRCGTATLIEVRLETGRRNQIRVHLAEAGHPLVGDRKYSRARRFPLNKMKRTALHAAVLAFEHPDGGGLFRFTSPLPGDIAAFAGPWRPD